MKKLVFVMLGVAMALTQACAQSKHDAPQKVKSAFAQKFPDAQKVKWEMEEENEWEAEFKLNGEEYSASFATDGTWKETESEIEASALPSAVTNTLKKEFGEYKIEEAELSETPKGKFYEVELEKGETDIEAVISANGKLIKKEIEKEHDGDNEDED